MVIGFRRESVIDLGENPRTSSMDGLGRLQQVTQRALGATTSYSYDALNDLMYVTPPSGFSGRSFSYSSLGRLESATNPESGITSYSYDPNGNVKTKTIGGATPPPTPTMDSTN